MRWLPISRAEKQAGLIGILTSDAPPQDKALACKQLAIYGGQDAVPALAALLPNAQLSSWARIALEVIPDPAADEALRESVGKVKGRLLVGVINSIGVRRDAKAVTALIGRLKDVDAAVALAAAVALGRIGGPGSQCVGAVAGQRPPAVRGAVAEGCTLCAERLLAEAHAVQAGKLYDAVRQADVPKPRVLDATRGAILARARPVACPHARHYWPRNCSRPTRRRLPWGWAWPARFRTAR